MTKLITLLIALAFFNIQSSVFAEPINVTEQQQAQAWKIIAESDDPACKTITDIRNGTGKYQNMTKDQRKQMISVELLNKCMSNLMMNATQSSEDL